ncbi:hypothetical protein PPERSA_10458 [Pseudocohnilembus persalinus]|uniref:Uncharacterized protein n=1 Tax=Pseudocohnilembus persalinus TaxID=266149 RepID=A0A0V0R1E0_PSEPJ|nr:hypothetical protein PPERSA_10458 [Pseudocohnilembus persalinus]|eukprot:KRX08096.1 hypothetical protein PPERSA_10458 [Pseudocohnilembus persalinus]
MKQILSLKNKMKTKIGKKIYPQKKLPQKNLNLLKNQEVILMQVNNIPQKNMLKKKIIYKMSKSKKKNQLQKIPKLLKGILQYINIYILLYIPINQGQIKIK